MMPPLPHPATNPSSFGNGRGVYEVEEEMLALHRALSVSRFFRLFQWERWRLWNLNFCYWPTTIRSVLDGRAKYELSRKDLRTVGNE